LLDERCTGSARGIGSRRGNTFGCQSICRQRTSPRTDQTNDGAHDPIDSQPNFSNASND